MSERGLMFPSPLFRHSHNSYSHPAGFISGICAKDYLRLLTSAPSHTTSDRGRERSVVDDCFNLAAEWKSWWDNLPCPVYLFLGCCLVSWATHRDAGVAFMWLRSFRLGACLKWYINVAVFGKILFFHRAPSGMQQTHQDAITITGCCGWRANVTLVI